MFIKFEKSYLFGAEQSASGAPSSEFRVPSSEFRAPRWGGWQQFRVPNKERSEGGKHPSQRVANIRVPSKEERRKKEGGKHPSSEFRVKKKERQGGKHPSSE